MRARRLTFPHNRTVARAQQQAGPAWGSGGEDQRDRVAEAIPPAAFERSWPTGERSLASAMASIIWRYFWLLAMPGFRATGPRVHDRATRHGRC